MTTAPISPEFQIVIPKEARQALGLRVGHRVEFVTKKDCLEIRPILAAEDLIGLLEHLPYTPLEREDGEREF